MKHINNYINDKIINEGLLSWLKAFIKKIKGNQTKLIGSDNKVNMLKMDVKKLKIQKEPASLIELIKDKDTMETWSNTKIGFPKSAAVAKNIKKIAPNVGETKSNPYVYTFYYNSESIYYAGILIYDKNIEYIPNYVHIISIETNLVVDNPTEVQKSMFEQFKSIIIKSKPSYEGFTSKESHEFMKGILTKLGFKKSEDNPEIYKIGK